MPAKKRNQHYVPRVLLRRFSKDDKTISLHLFSSRQTVERAPLKHQCSANYFYGSNGNIENMLAGLEDVVGRLLNKPWHEAGWSFSPEDDQVLRLFVAYQRQRTRVAAQGANDRLDALMKHIAPHMEELRDVDLERFRFVYSNPAIACIQAASAAFPVFLDLRIKFIVNNKQIPFITSDSPVVAYNQFAEFAPGLSRCSGTQGTSAKGLQLFLPISPTVMVHLYDGSTYTVGAKDGHVCKPSARDIRYLNAMQAINAQSCIYFRPGSLDEGYIRELARERSRHPSVHETALVPISGSVASPAGAPTPIFMEFRDTRVGARFGFVRVIESRSFVGYPHPAVPPRSLELLAMSEEWSRNADAIRNEVESDDARVPAPDSEDDSRGS